MLFRLFAKETFESIEKELNQVFQSLGLSKSKLKIRKKPATYFKPYTYIVEGEMKGYRFVLSLHSSALSKEEVKQQVELIIYCENPSWISLEVYKKGLNEPQKKNLGSQEIIVEELSKHKIAVACNQVDFVRAVFNQGFCKKISTINHSSFLSYRVERKHLYYQTTSMPDHADKSNLLVQAINISLALVQQIDSWQSNT